MAFERGEFEITDNLGSTEAFSGTATTTVQNVPAVAGNVISGVLITASGNNLEVSFDNGTSFYEIPRNGTLTWDVKGEITQLQIRTAGGSRDFRGYLNLEVY